MIRTRNNLLWWALAGLALLIMSRKQTAAAAPATSTEDGTMLLNGRVLLPPGLWRTEDWRTWQQIGAAQ